MAKIIKTVSFSIIKCTSWQSRSMINIFLLNLRHVTEYMYLQDQTFTEIQLDPGPTKFIIGIFLSIFYSVLGEAVWFKHCFIGMFNPSYLQWDQWFQFQRQKRNILHVIVIENNCLAEVKCKLTNTSGPITLMVVL